MSTLGSLFTGIEGLDMAVAEFFNAEVRWVSEVEKPLLDRYTVPNLGDVTKVDWHGIRRWMVPNHRCDEKAAAMYERYNTGLSLADVAAEYGITRQSVYGMFSSRGWPLRSNPPQRKTIEYDGQRYSLRNNGYFGATKGKRGLLHRAVWEKERGLIPDGWDVHHLDGDKSNNDVSNLECLPKADHTRRYSPHCNQHHHKCSDCGEGVVPTDSPAVDILCGGYP